jgi:hypothetical protein
MMGVAALAAVWLAGCASDDGAPAAGSDTQTSDTVGGDDTSVADDTTAASDTATAGDSGPGADSGDVTVTLPAPTVTTTVYRTADQMLLANEINESGEPFAEALGYDLDALDPAVPGVPDDTAYVLGIDNYEYSRYQLGTVISRSGIGLHMMWAPMIGQMAAMEGADFDGSMTPAPNGVKEDDELIKNIMMFSALSNQPPPGNPWPQFAEFVSGDPHLPQAIDADTFAWGDFSTLRWDRSKMDKTLNPAALGQTLMKQYLWAQDMLSAFHDADDNGIEADGTVSPDATGGPEFDPTNGVFFGGSALDGFIGMVLTAEGINKVAFLKEMLAYDGATLGAIDLATYDPANGIQYFPHAVAVTESMVQEGLPPRATAFAVTDASSHLFDQASLLWGTTSFADMMDPSIDSDPAHLAYRAVFDGSPFPASMSETGTPGPYDLMKGTSKALFLNLQALHRDAAHAVYVEVATLNGATVERGAEVTAVGSAYAIVALESFIAQFDGTPLEAMAVQAVTDQARFLAAHGSDGAGAYYDAVTLDGVGTTQSLDAQAAAVRALYVAARVSGDAALATAADEAYAALISRYYDDGFEIFRSDAASDLAVYTPRTVALLAGALREAALEGGATEAPGIYTEFFLRVAGKMQLSEGASSGETGGDSDGDGIPFIPEQPDGLPPVFATQATFDLGG